MKNKTPEVAKETVTESTDPTKFESKLEPGPGRFLAYMIEHAFAVSRRSPDDFVRHFPPAQIMAGLELRPNLRADILEPTTGTRRKIGLRKPSASAGEDLQIALDEGEASAAQVVELFRPDDRVKYLDNRALWSFVVEGEFWRADASSGAAFEQAKTHIAFILDRALLDGLLSHADLIEGASVATLAKSLPRETLAEIIGAALERGRSGKAFTEKDLLDTAAARILVEDVSLAHLWETVILPKIARAHGFAAAQAIIVEEAAIKPQAAAMPAASTTTTPSDASGNDEKRKPRDSWTVSGVTDTRKPKPTAKTAGPADLSELSEAVEELEVEDFDIDDEEFAPN